MDGLTALEGISHRSFWLIRPRSTTIAISVISVQRAKTPEASLPPSHTASNITNLQNVTMRMAYWQKCQGLPRIAPCIHMYWGGEGQSTICILSATVAARTNTSPNSVLGLYIYFPVWSKTSCTYFTLKMINRSFFLCCVLSPGSFKNTDH